MKKIYNGNNDEIKSETIADYSKISIEFDSDELSWIRAALINAHDKVRERKDDDEKEACEAILALLRKINEVNPI